MDVLLAGDGHIRQILLANDVLRSLVIKELLLTEKLNIGNISNNARRRITSSDIVLQRIRQSPLHKAVAVNSSIDFACRNIAETFEEVVDQNQLIESFIEQDIYVRADNLSLKEEEKISQDINELFFPFKKRILNERLLLLSPQEIELRHAQSSRNIFILVTYHPNLYDPKLVSGIETLSVEKFQEKLDCEKNLEILIEHTGVSVSHDLKSDSLIASCMVSEEIAFDKFESDEHEIDNNLKLNFSMERESWFQVGSGYQYDLQVLLVIDDKEADKLGAECIAIFSVALHLYHALISSFVNSLNDVESRSLTDVFNSTLFDELRNEIDAILNIAKDAISNFSKSLESNIYGISSDIKFNELSRFLNLFFSREIDLEIDFLSPNYEETFYPDREEDIYPSRDYGKSDYTVDTVDILEDFESDLISFEFPETQIESNDFWAESNFMPSVNDSDGISFNSSKPIDNSIKLDEYFEEFISKFVQFIGEIITNNILAIVKEVNIDNESDIDDSRVELLFPSPEKEDKVELLFLALEEEDKAKFLFPSPEEEDKAKFLFPSPEKEDKIELLFPSSEEEDKSMSIDVFGGQYEILVTDEEGSIVVDVIGGQYEIAVLDYEASIAISNFGGIGEGTKPKSEILKELDVINFGGEIFSAENMFLQQEADELIISFRGLNEFSIILDEFYLEWIDNIPSRDSQSEFIGNILFHDDQQIEDSFDVINPETEIDKVFVIDQVTFLNGLENITYGLDSSDDVIYGNSGDDQLFGESGRDSLYGEEGSDLLDGGLGDDLLSGGLGADKFVLSLDGSIDTIIDFNVEEDILLLSEGLYLDDIEFHASGSLGTESTIIRTRSTNEVVAELIGVDSFLVDNSFFMTNI